jgi:hypothetical protein
MTHTLHRVGTPENLSKDFIFLCMAAKNINEEGSDEKMKEFLRIMMRHNPVNVGDMRTGNMYHTDTKDIVDKVTSTSIVHGVFTDTKTVVDILKELKKADLGMSVVVSGVCSTVKECCQKAGLAPHSIDYSAGIWGKTGKLPPKEVLEVTTMCGHAMVASSLVRHMVQDIKKGARTADDAAKELAKECECGIFNPARAASLLSAMAAK